MESYIGLVEVGVGLLPAGGGLKEAAIRAAQGVALAGRQALSAFGGDLGWTHSSVDTGKRQARRLQRL